MKKNCLCICICLLCNIMVGQEFISDAPSEITLPSPTAFQFTKYGNVSINEQSGRISPSIPICEYVAGKLSHPISLNYVGNGVKVDQLCSWTGINWNLNAGGVITRIVRDYPDERTESGKRILFSEAEYDAMDLVDGSPDIILLNKITMDPAYDTQVDIFQYSFPGYSGSFFLDENFEPVQTNYESELIIFKTSEQSDGIEGFTIITPDGIRYVFGGSLATEKSRMNPGAQGSISTYTAYYLTTIIHPLGDTILLEYTSIENPFTINLSQTQHIWRRIVSGPVGICPARGDNLNHEGIDVLQNRIEGAKYLSRISSTRSNLAINFNSVNAPLESEYQRILNSIEIIDKQTNTKVKTIDLDYITDNEDDRNQRFFLEKVTFNGKSIAGLKAQNSYEYKMEYYEPLSLPKRFSFEQDHLGYFNNKETNTTLLPKNSSGAFDDMNSYLADREPSFDDARKGSLVKLFYPTGGYTHFQYEAPTIKTLDVDRIQMEAYCTQDNRNPTTILSDTYLLSHFSDEDLENPHKGILLDQNIEVNIAVTAQGNINNHYIITFRVIDITDPQHQYEDTHSFVLAPDVYHYNKTYTYALEKDHVYRVKLELDPNSSSSMIPSPVSISAAFNFAQGYESVENGGLGLRIKKVSDFSGAGSEPFITRYYYKAAKDLDTPYESSVLATNWNSYYFQTPYVSCCLQDNDDPNFPDIPQFDVYSYANLQCNTINSLLPTSDNAWLYRNVTISYGGDNFEAGGIQKDFSLKSATYTYPKIYPEAYYSGISSFETQRDNNDMYNGKILKETFLKRGSEGVLCKIKDIGYEYSSSEYFVTNAIVRRLHDVCEIGGSIYLDKTNSIKGLYLSLFKTITKINNLKEVTTTEYIDPVPIDVTDESQYETVVSTTKYLYGYVGLPIIIYSNTSEEDKIIKTKNYYAGYYQLENLDPQDLENYNRMHTFHMIATPIQVENYYADVPVEFNDEDVDSIRIINSKKISTKRVLYNEDMMPSKLQISLGDNPLEDRVLYTSYDNYGNLIETSKVDDISTIFIWGYNQSQLIAKIENIKETELTSTALQRISEAKTASNADINASSENNLRIALNLVRNELPDNARMTYYTYDLPFGVTSISDINGVTTYYEYDGLGRLITTKDDQLNLIKEYCYFLNDSIAEAPGVYYEITKDLSEFGIVNLSTSTIQAGNNCTLSIIPIEGYHVEDLIINGVSKGSVSNFVIVNVQANQHITVQYAINTYTIVASITGSGTITPSGTTTVNSSSNITYSFVPASGYHIKDVIIDGELSAGAVTSFTFSNILSNRSITVEFEQDPYLEVNSSAMAFVQNGGTHSFSISSNLSWTISSSVAWLTITPTSGSNSSIINVTCSRYPLGNRSGIITISGGGFTRTINVSQPTLE